MMLLSRRRSEAQNLSEESISPKNPKASNPKPEGLKPETHRVAKPPTRTPIRRGPSEPVANRGVESLLRFKV